MVAGIYLIMNKKTNQKYVGGSINIGKRLKDHKAGKFAYKQYIDRAIKKHGKDNFVYQIITELPADWGIINQHEKYWIKYYNTYKNPKHYNLTKGGEGTQGYFPNNITRQKMSDAKSGKNHPQWKNYPRIVKNGMKNSKQTYCIKYEGKMLKRSVDYEFLEYLLDKFVSGELTKKQVENYSILKYRFKYTCIKAGFNKHGEQKYKIDTYNSTKTLITSKEKKFIQFIADKLNNKEIVEDYVMNTPISTLKTLFYMEAEL